MKKDELSSFLESKWIWEYCSILGVGIKSELTDLPGL